MWQFWGAAIFFSLYAHDVFYGPGEIHYDIDEALQLWQRHEDKGLGELGRLCLKKEAFSYYACYTLGKILWEKRQVSSAKQYIEESLKLKPNFVPALNFKLNILKEPIELKDRALHHYFRALYFVERNKKDLARQEIKKALNHGASLVYFQENPLFSSLGFFEIAKNKKKDEERQLLDFSHLRRSESFIDPAYTYEEHQKTKDPSQLLYDYYMALDAQDKESTFAYLRRFLEKLERHSSELAANMLLFLWQNPSFSHLKNYPEWKSFVLHLGKKYEIPTSFH